MIFIISLLLTLCLIINKIYCLQVQEYDCYLCILTVENAIEIKEQSFLKSCSNLFYNSSVCSDYDVFLSDFLINYNEEIKNKDNDISRNICINKNICHNLDNEKWKENILPKDINFDVRISKGYGSRGYDKVRVSVISNRSITSDIFTYSHQFKYRWTNNYINTGIVTVIPGQNTIIKIENEEYNIFIPKENDPIRGVIIADPCYSKEFVWCSYGDQMNIFNRTLQLLNLINSNNDFNFWMILGDNFYDQTGNITKTWFNSLSKESKSKVFGTVPGNHDFWIMSAPTVWTRKDQLGNGFMQYYAQDTQSSIINENNNINVPFDYTNDPDDFTDNKSRREKALHIPKASNFFSYYNIGNVGFISYSGAHSYEEMESSFEEACNFMTNDSNPSTILLLGHWNTPGLGCELEMNVPSTYKELLNIPVCSSLKNKMRYLMGHMHCNVVVEDDIGFMVAGQGMTASELACDGNFGFPVIDTYDDKFSIYYFDIQQISRENIVGYDNYDKIYNCILEKGVTGCYALAKQWMSVAV